LVIILKAACIELYAAKITSALFPFIFSFFSPTTIVCPANAANPLISTPKEILATSPSERVLYSWGSSEFSDRGEKLPQTSFIEIHVGNAIPFMNFF